VRGGHLASIVDANDEDRVRALLDGTASGDARAWIGLYQTLSSDGESMLEWIDGTEFVFASDR